MTTPEYIGKYIKEKELGQGAFGVVYAAWDPRLERQVAVKMLHPHISQNKQWVEKFKGEARFLARFDRHPNVARIIELNEGEGGLFIVMDYYKDGSLRDLILSEGPLPWERALQFTLEIASGLSAAHDEKLVHRDIKPSNVLLDHNTCRITDFGVAASSTDGSIHSRIGTPGYLSPEQALGRSTDARADIYSLGVTLYVMLTGSLPRELSHTELPPDPRIRHTEIPERLVEILFKAIEFDPENRCESANELIDGLEGLRRAEAAKKDEQEKLHREEKAAKKAVLERLRRKRERAKAAKKDEQEKLHREEEAAKNNAERARAEGEASFKSGLSYYNRGEFEQAIKSFNLCV